MMKRIVKIAAALGVLATVGTTMLSLDANAGTRTCYKCTGGWCCY